VEALTDLQRIGRPMQLPAGKVLFREGFKSEGVYILCSGVVKLTISSAEGRLLILRLAWPGDVLGLVAALRDCSYEATAETLEQTKVKAVSRADFKAFLDTFHEASRHAALAAAMQYESALLSARLLALSNSAAGKLANALLLWTKLRTNDRELPISFRMPLTHEELGNMAGISRETVTRLLSQFRNEGLVEQQGQHFTLPRPDRMELLYCQ
jgi:CRP/FNR family transcriptional regulator